MNVANFPAVQPVSIADPMSVNATVVGTPAVSLSGGLVSTAVTLIAPATVDGQPYADGVALAGGANHAITFVPPAGTQVASLVLKNRGGGMVTWNPLGAAGPFSYDLQPGDVVSGDLALSAINVYTPTPTTLNNPSAPGLIAWMGVQPLPPAAPAPTPATPAPTATPGSTLTANPTLTATPSPTLTATPTYGPAATVTPSATSLPTSSSLSRAPQGGH